MCGLVGFLQVGGFKLIEARQTVETMSKSLVHRGPDDSGVWLDMNAGIALGHQRLSILDLSPAGHQPMHSASGRYVMVFNGEIYNHHSLRNLLDSTAIHSWRGHSDTETLLASIEAWGIEKAVQAAVGMFALALWDRQERTLILARDRMGEKPLYYGWQGGFLLFGSELKALLAHPAFRKDIDQDVLSLYLRYGYIPAPWSIWKGIRKLAPGCTFRYVAEQVGEMPDPKPYWSQAEAIARGLVEPFRGTDEEAINTLETKLSEVVAGQMVADVPLGAFLSGGIDSSTVVALMQAKSVRPVKTFTIGFEEACYNEAEHAKAVASYLGTEHTELYVTATQAREVIPMLPDMYDEPFGDPSAIPTYLVSKLARQHVTVSLSGDGGDELFGGYSHYASSAAVWQASQQIPRSVRQLVGGVLAAMPEWRVSGQSLPGPIDRGSRLCCTSYERFRSLGYQMMFENILALLDFRRAVFRNPGELLNYARNNVFPSDASIFQPFSPLVAMMGYEAGQYLPDDIMVKVDRASMAVSLESRAPLLDHRVVELAARLPEAMKIRGVTGKWVLRELLYRHVPRSLVDRTKAGFGVPITDWLRGPLREYGEELLSSTFLKRQDLFNANFIRKQWHLFQAGRLDYGSQIWVLMMFQAWYNSNF